MALGALLVLVPFEEPVPVAVALAAEPLEVALQRLVAFAKEVHRAELPVQLEGLTAAVGSGDCLLAGQLAHTIKGASANVGGEALREMGFELEKAGKAGDLAALKALLPGTRECFARLKDAMERAAEPGEPSHANPDR